MPVTCIMLSRLVIIYLLTIYDATATTATSDAAVSVIFCLLSKYEDCKQFLVRVKAGKVGSLDAASISTHWPLREVRSDRLRPRASVETVRFSNVADKPCMQHR